MVFGVIYWAVWRVVLPKIFLKLLPKYNINHEAEEEEVCSSPPLLQNRNKSLTPIH